MSIDDLRPTPGAGPSASPSPARGRARLRFPRRPAVTPEHRDSIPAVVFWSAWLLAPALVLGMLRRAGEWPMGPTLAGLVVVEAIAAYTAWSFKRTYARRWAEGALAREEIDSDHRDLWR